MSTPTFGLPPVSWRARALAAVVCALAGILALTLAAPGLAEAAKRKKRPHTVKVMTRNLYLGADLSDAASAGTLDELCDEAGEVYRDVDTTNFPKRSKALAAEILKRKPDLVGLQEGALWRTDTPADQGPILGGTPALTVRYDFIKILLNQLNKGPGSKYRLVTSREQFDFEVSANADGVGSGCADSEIDGRLTMRDAIIARNKAGVKTRGVRTGTYTNVFEFMPVGLPYPVKRGWVSAKVRVRGSKPFTFVNTHLEAFDDGTIRNDQAKQLLADAAKGARVIMVGDFNSDVDDPGASSSAYKSVIAGGFKLRQKPQVGTSGVPDELLVNGTVADFDRQIDLIFANRKSIRRLSSSVFGKARVNGMFPTDHAGVITKLRIP